MAGLGLVLVLVALPSIASARSYFSAGPSMPAGRVAANFAPLPNGNVLVAGGFDGADRLATAWVLNPVTGLYDPTGSMTTARQQSATVPIAGGKVLVAGGMNDSEGRLNSAELYDFRTGTFTALAAQMSSRRQAPAAALLPDGRVLIAGGYWTTYLATAEIYDPETRTFAPTEPMSVARSGAVAAPLPDGRVLVAGGYNGTSQRLSSAEIYDPVTGKFSTPSATMGVARSEAAGVPLPDGRVLIAGGAGAAGGTYLSSVETFDTVSTLPCGRGAAVA